MKYQFNAEGRKQIWIALVSLGRRVARGQIDRSEAERKADVLDRAQLRLKRLGDGQVGQ